MLLFDVQFGSGRQAISLHCSSLPWKLLPQIRPSAFVLKISRAPGTPTASRVTLVPEDGSAWDSNK